jgi:hypothetical protein
VAIRDARAAPEAMAGFLTPFHAGIEAASFKARARGLATNKVSNGTAWAGPAPLHWQLNASLTLLEIFRFSMQVRYDVNILKA